MDPANAAEPYNYLGYMWAEQNIHLDEAEGLRQTVRCSSTRITVPTSMSIAWAEYRQGKYDQALVALSRSAHLRICRAKMLSFLEHLGDVYLKLKPRVAGAGSVAEGENP